MGCIQDTELGHNSSPTRTDGFSLMLDASLEMCLPFLRQRRNLRLPTPKCVHGDCVIWFSLHQKGISYVRYRLRTFS